MTLAGLLQGGTVWSLWILAGVYAFVLPGWVILRWGWKGFNRWDGLSKLGAAVGAGISFNAVLFVWLDLIGFHPGAVQAWLPGGLALTLLIGANYRRLDLEKLRRTRDDLTFESALSYGLLAAALLLIAAVRYWVIRTQPAPLWGDSVQHAVITQRILESGGLFESWLPYSPYDSLTVHTGFHVFAAVLGWLRGADGIQAVLYGGQVLNLFAVITIAPLAIKIARGDRWAGIGALVFAGLVSQNPSFYANWGRYPQLIGQAALPAAAFLLWDLMDRARQNLPAKRAWTMAAVAGGTAAGMTLGYFRMPFYFLVFILLLLPGWGIPTYGRELRKWAAGFGWAAAAGGIALLLFAPWIPRLAGSNLTGMVAGGLETSYSLEAALVELGFWNTATIELFLPPIYLYLGILIAIAAIAEREWLVALLPLWVALLVAYPLGRVLNFPGANMLQNFAIVIWIYMPVSLLMGWGLSRLRGLADHGLWPGALGLGLFAVMGFSAWDRRADLKPEQFAMVTYPDLAAMDWIAANTDDDAVFLVQGFRIWEGRSIVGSDAGWWLPLYTKRQNTIPPQYALMNERPINPAYSLQVVEDMAALEPISLDTPAGLAYLCERGITHVFNGQRRGLVGSGLDAPLFTSAELAGQPALDRVYMEDRVEVYALDRDACGDGNG